LQSGGELRGLDGDGGEVGGLASCVVFRFVHGIDGL
jgi:hypothetical protein